MSGTCGPMSCVPFAKWDRDSQSWKTSEVTSLWALTLSSLTLPQWGGLRGGELFEHPTPGRLTSGLDCSSLPTPNAADGKRYNLTHQRGEGNPTLLGAVHHLPTPVADHSRGLPSSTTDYASLANVAALLLPIEAQRLLPTPTSQAAKHGELSPVEREGNRRQDNGNLWVVMPRLVGETTALPSTDGSASQDDQPQHLLSLDELAHPD